LALSSALPRFFNIIRCFPYQHACKARNTTTYPQLWRHFRALLAAVQHSKCASHPYKGLDRSLYPCPFLPTGMCSFGNRFANVHDLAHDQLNLGMVMSSSGVIDRVTDVLGRHSLYLMICQSRFSHRALRVPDSLALYLTHHIDGNIDISLLPCLSICKSECLEIVTSSQSPSDWYNIERLHRNGFEYLEIVRPESQTDCVDTKKKPSI